MDTFIEKAMNIILRDGTIFTFDKHVLGLYYYYMEITDVWDSAKTNTKITPYSLLSIVTYNK